MLCWLPRRVIEEPTKEHRFSAASGCTANRGQNDANELGSAARGVKRPMKPPVFSMTFSTKLPAHYKMSAMARDCLEKR